MLKQYTTYDVLSCQNKGRKISQECPPVPIKHPIRTFWLAIVQALKREHLDAISQLNLLQALYLWKTFLLFQFPFQKHGESQYFLSFSVIL